MKIWDRIKADELKLARYSRGFLLWAATVVGQVLTAGIEAASSWSGKQWAARLFVGAIAGTAGLITAGTKAPK